MPVREFAWRFAPGVMANRAVRWQFAHHPETSDPWTVEGGPFAGLHYPSGIETTCAVNLKRRGNYEKAVVSFLAEEFEKTPPVFVDIGAAEGYYAVSAACVGIQTIAYESSSIQRSVLRRVAEANGVEIEIRKHCRRVPALPPSSVVLMDAEGAETELLCPEAVERLRESIVVVEMHELFVPGVTDTLRRRFEHSHSCEILEEDEPLRTGRGRWAIFRPIARP